MCVCVCVSVMCGSASACTSQEPLPDPVQVIDTEREGAQEVYNLRALPTADE